MTEQPKVSVLMITYNHEAFIVQAVESVLMQETDFNIELVIGEDCSTDNTRAVLLDYVDRFPDRINLLLPEQNLGMNRNFVQTYEACRGEYIAILEGDDYWVDPYKLQKQVDFLDANPDYVLCHHNAKCYDAAGNMIKDSQYPISSQVDYSSEQLSKGAWVLTLTACFRNVLHEFPIEFYEVPFADVFLWSLLGNFGPSKYLGETILPAAYRVHSGGVWSSLRDDWERIFRRLETYYWLRKYYVRQQLHDAERFFIYQLAGDEVLYRLIDLEEFEEKLANYLVRLEDYLTARYGNTEDYKAIHEILYAHIYVTVAFVFYARKEWDRGEVYLKQAIELDPLAWNNEMPFEEFLADHGIALAEIPDAFEGMLNFIEGIQHHLPLEMRPDNKVIRMIVGRLYAVLAYRCYLDQDATGVKIYTLSALKANPRLMKDRGLLRRAITTYLPAWGPKATLWRI